MIISHEHQYLFIEVPLTASWAIRHELCEHYDGTPILHKHASYPEFLRVAGQTERDYFAFATVRNPLDVAVSRYVKYKTNHKGAFSTPEARKGLRVDNGDLAKFRFIQETNGSFEAYIKRFHRRPYNNIINLSREQLDFVIRYEELQEGFSEVLRRLGIEQVGPIPMRNKTRQKRDDWESYYSAEIVEQAKRSFGPFMTQWGYDFPDEWGSYEPRWQDELKFRLFSIAQRFYLLHIRYSHGPHARLLRSLRGWLTAILA
jgi:hypothetical protein